MNVHTVRIAIHLVLGENRCGLDPSVVGLYVNGIQVLCRPTDQALTYIYRPTDTKYDKRCTENRKENK